MHNLMKVNCLSDCGQSRSPAAAAASPGVMLAKDGIKQIGAGQSRNLFVKDN